MQSSAECVFSTSCSCISTNGLLPWATVAKNLLFTSMANSEDSEDAGDQEGPLSEDARVGGGLTMQYNKIMMELRPLRLPPVMCSACGSLLCLPAFSPVFLRCAVLLSPAELENVMTKVDMIHWGICVGICWVARADLSLSSAQRCLASSILRPNHDTAMENEFQRHWLWTFCIPQ